MLIENTGICLYFTQQHNNFWGKRMNRYIIFEHIFGEYMFRFNYLQRIRIRPEVVHTVSKGEITLQTNDNS